jgi:hypothetical protein
MLTASEYAAQNGISARRARKLAESGAISARRHGRMWVIEEAARQEVAGARPMGEQMRRAVMSALGDQELAGLTGPVRARAAAHLRQLRESENPAALLRAWFRGGQPPTGFAHGAVVVRDALDGRDERVREYLRRPKRKFLYSYSKLAGVVRAERSISGLTRAGLAQAAGLSPAVVAAIESGKPAAIPDIRRALRALHVEPLALPPVHVKVPKP